MSAIQSRLFTVAIVHQYIAQPCLQHLSLSVGYHPLRLMFLVVALVSCTCYHYLCLVYFSYRMSSYLIHVITFSSFYNFYHSTSCISYRILSVACYHSLTCVYLFSIFCICYPPLCALYDYVIILSTPCICIILPVSYIFCQRLSPEEPPIASITYLASNSSLSSGIYYPFSSTCLSMFFFYLSKLYISIFLTYFISTFNLFLASLFLALSFFNTSISDSIHQIVFLQRLSFLHFLSQHPITFASTPYIPPSRTSRRQHLFLFFPGVLLFRLPLFSIPPF